MFCSSEQDFPILSFSRLRRGEGGRERGHLALRQGTAAPCTPASLRELESPGSFSHHCPDQAQLWQNAGTTGKKTSGQDSASSEQKKRESPVPKTVISSPQLFDFNVSSPTPSEHLYHDPNVHVGVEGNRTWRGTSRRLHEDSYHSRRFPTIDLKNHRTFTPFTNKPCIIIHLPQSKQPLDTHS